MAFPLRVWACSAVLQIFTEDEPDTEEKGKGQGELYKKINWLRAGILSADKVMTVSPNYAEEIAKNPQLGVELDDVLRCALARFPCLATRMGFRGLQEGALSLAGCSTRVMPVGHISLIRRAA